MKSIIFVTNFQVKPVGWYCPEKDVHSNNETVEGFFFLFSQGHFRWLRNFRTQMYGLGLSRIACTSEYCCCWMSFTVPVTGNSLEFKWLGVAANVEKSCISDSSFPIKANIYVYYIFPRSASNGHTSVCPIWCVAAIHVWGVHLFHVSCWPLAIIKHLQI